MSTARDGVRSDVPERLRTVSIDVPRGAVEFTDGGAQFTAAEQMLNSRGTVMGGASLGIIASAVLNSQVAIDHGCGFQLGLDLVFKRGMEVGDVATVIVSLREQTEGVTVFTVELEVRHEVYISGKATLRARRDLPLVQPAVLGPDVSLARLNMPAASGVPWGLAVDFDEEVPFLSAVLPLKDYAAITSVYNCEPLGVCKAVTRHARISVPTSASGNVTRLVCHGDKPTLHGARDLGVHIDLYEEDADSRRRIGTGGISMKAICCDAITPHQAYWSL